MTTRGSLKKGTRVAEESVPGRTKPPSYFEAVIQLRDCKEDVVEFLWNAAESQSNPDLFISHINPLKNGWDLYISNNQFAMKIASQIPKKYGGRIQTSSSLFSRDHQTSKNLMRLTVLYRGLDFELGDVLALPVKQTVVQVKALSTTIKVFDLKKGAMMGVAPNRTHYRKLDVVKTRVVRISPSIQILDPESYQPVEVKNENFKAKLDQEVTAVYWLGWWIVE